MQTEKVKIKNGEIIIFTATKENNYYFLDAFNLNNKKVASMYFKLDNKNCDLKRIEILSPKYSHLGIGSYMLTYMEKFAIDNYSFKVNGKFYPFGDLGEFAKNFYIKNGYEIYKDGYETYIYKSLQLNQIKEKNL